MGDVSSTIKRLPKQKRERTRRALAASERPACARRGGARRRARCSRRATRRCSPRQSERARPLACLVNQRNIYYISQTGCGKKKSRCYVLRPRSGCLRGNKRGPQLGSFEQPGGARRDLGCIENSEKQNRFSEFRSFSATKTIKFSAKKENTFVVRLCGWCTDSNRTFLFFQRRVDQF